MSEPDVEDVKAYFLQVGPLTLVSWFFYIFTKKVREHISAGLEEVNAGNDDDSSSSVNQNARSSNMIPLHVDIITDTNGQINNSEDPLLVVDSNPTSETVDIVVQNHTSKSTNEKEIEKGSSQVH